MKKVILVIIILIAIFLAWQYKAQIECKLANNIWMNSKNCCCPAICITADWPEGEMPTECLCCSR